MAGKLSAALLIMSASGAAAAPVLAANTDNHAAAFGWRGYADTDLQFSEFYGGDYTLMARFMVQYPNAYTGPILSVNGSGTFFVAKAYDQARLQVNLGGNQQTLDLPNPLLAGVWYHLTLVSTGGSYTFYLDGNQICQACSVSAGNSPPNGTLRLGRLTVGATDNGHEAQFYGFVDDVAVFKAALSASQITAIAAAPRLDGSEPNLHAGYTFDSATPGGGALPAALSRPVSFLTLTSGPQIPGTPAYATVVSQQRDSLADAPLLPPPFQQTTMRLPFPVGEAWQVIQGWDNPSGSHHGPASFAWDFILAGHPQSDTQGKPIYAAGPGTVVETRNDRDSCSGYPASYVMIQQAPSEIGAYLHFIKGSVAVAANQVVVGGDFLANAGDTGNTGCGAYHLHYTAREPGRRARYFPRGLQQLRGVDRRRRNVAGRRARRPEERRLGEVAGQRGCGLQRGRSLSRRVRGVDHERDPGRERFQRSGRRSPDVHLDRPLRGRRGDGGGPHVALPRHRNLLGGPEGQRRLRGGHLQRVRHRRGQRAADGDVRGGRSRARSSGPRAGRRRAGGHRPRRLRRAAGRGGEGLQRRGRPDGDRRRPLLARCA